MGAWGTHMGAGAAVGVVAAWAVEVAMLPSVFARDTKLGACRPPPSLHHAYSPSPSRSYLDGNPNLVLPPAVAALPCLTESADYGTNPEAFKSEAQYKP